MSKSTKQKQLQQNVTPILQWHDQLPATAYCINLHFFSDNHVRNINLKKLKHRITTPAKQFMEVLPL